MVRSLSYCLSSLLFGRLFLLLFLHLLDFAGTISFESLSLKPAIELVNLFLVGARCFSLMLRVRIERSGFG